MSITLLSTCTAGRRPWPAGVRYARIQHNFTAIEIDDNDGSIDTRIFGFNDFEGIGPTVALEIKRQIPCTRFSLFASTRGSVLFGESDLEFTQFDFETDTVPERLTSLGDSRMVGILETSVGVESYWLLNECWTGFVRASLEAQYWIRGGTAVTQALGEDRFDANGQDPRNEDMGFLGFNLRTGLLW